MLEILYRICPLTQAEVHFSSWENKHVLDFFYCLFVSPPMLKCALGYSHGTHVHRYCPFSNWGGGTVAVIGIPQFWNVLFLCRQLALSWGKVEVSYKWCEPRRTVGQREQVAQVCLDGLDGRGWGLTCRASLAHLAVRTSKSVKSHKRCWAVILVRWSVR